MPTSNNSGSRSFASALRSLAKQAEIKDDEPVDQRAPSAGTSGSNNAPNNMHLHQRPSSSADNRNQESAVAVDNRQKRKANSPPPEKVFILFSKILSIKKYFKFKMHTKFKTLTN